MYIFGSSKINDLEIRQSLNMQINNVTVLAI